MPNTSKPDSQTNPALVFARLLLVGLVMLGVIGCSDGPKSFDDLLAPLMPPSPAQTARDAFNVHDPDLRRRSVALLSAASFGGEQPYLRMYRLLVDDTDATVRAACIKAIGQHGTLEDAPLLVAHLKDEDTFVRWEAAKALQKVHYPGATGPLVRAITDDEDADVRMAAAYALGQYPEMRVYHALVGALNDQSFSVVQAAQHALQTLTGYDFGYEASLWLMWAQKQADNVFDDRQPYRWQPYTKPPKLIDKALFWIERSPVESKPPKGLETPQAQDEPQANSDS